MSDALLLFLGGVIGAIVQSVLAPILSARFSKTKREKDADLAKEYLTLADMSAEQLERRINLIGQLDERISRQEKKVRALEKENEELAQSRAERDERIEALEAHTSALKKQIQKDTEETQRLRNDYALVQKDNIRLYEVTIGLTQAVEKIKKAVQDAGIALQLNGELDHLLESVYRLKVEREQWSKQ